MSVAPDPVLVVIARTRHKMIQAELHAAGRAGAKFVELRLDYLTKAAEFKRLLPYKACPWVCTFRRPQDGGRWAGTEAERQIVLKQAIVSGAFEWVDLETDIADAIRRFGPVKRIVSYHNMTETPADLEGIYKEMLKQDADVYKLAVLANSADDNRRILELQKSAPKPTVAFGMGEFGFPTRFLALKHGAPWIYAAFNRERGIAPGLPTLEELHTKYPVRTVGRDTKVFGLLGDPVGHSHGPVLHNHMFRRMKQDAIYLPFRVPAADLNNAIAAFDQVPVSGYSVTIPHKEAAAEIAGKGGSDTVQLTKAANTLIRQPDGKFQAHNTDFTAILDSLQSHLEAQAKDGPAVSFSQLFVMILGAGGAARAAAHALAREGAHLTITARTHDKAAKLATEVQCKVVDWVARHNVNPCHVVINCTPVGMHPNVDESPLHASFLKPGLTVFDTVYTPENTRLILDARARGCDVVTGVDMFVRQAARQFEMFIGIAPPVDQMRDLLRKAMSPVTGALGEEAERTGHDEAAQQEKPTDPVPVESATRRVEGPTRRILLIGYRGTGKTTTGPLLAAKLGWEFIDADEHLEKSAKMAIADVFRSEGETGFRDRESAVLAELCKKDYTVIACGGGAVVRVENRSLMTKSGFVAWLTATPDTVWQRLQADPTTGGRRPNLTSTGGMAEVVSLMAAREPAYKGVAGVAVATDGRSPEAVADDILVAWEATAPSPPANG